MACSRVNFNFLTLNPVRVLNRCKFKILWTTKSEMNYIKIRTVWQNFVFFTIQYKLVLSLDAVTYRQMDEHVETSRCSSKFTSETCLQIPDYLASQYKCQCFSSVLLPPHVTILTIKSTQSGFCSAGLLTQHMLLVADQCFVTAYHSLEEGTNRPSCDISRQLPIFIVLP
jgi:hypothetical protein